jgi:phospholipid-transporting ATPase
MPDRMIYSNLPDRKLPDNRIETSKYNFFTFLPKNLFEQFRKFANIYFLLIGGLQMIKEISTSSGQPVIYLPLMVILIITALKDLIEDLKRHKSDREENSKQCLLLRNHGWERVDWSELRVGDVVKV